jgi:predicted  nucleic acid-binding Zn-ribbon protein
MAIHPQSAHAPAPHSLEDAVVRLDAALGQLEAAAQRRLEAERRRGDLETELTLMQDDRTRLAAELDGTMARLARVEGAASDVGVRLDRAMGTIRDVIASAERQN